MTSFEFHASFALTLIAAIAISFGLREFWDSPSMPDDYDPDAEGGAR